MWEYLQIFLNASIIITLCLWQIQYKKHLSRNIFEYKYKYQCLWEYLVIYWNIPVIVTLCSEVMSGSPTTVMKKVTKIHREKNTISMKFGPHNLRGVCVAKTDQCKWHWKKIFTILFYWEKRLFFNVIYRLLFKSEKWYKLRLFRICQKIQDSRLKIQDSRSCDKMLMEL